MLLVKGIPYREVQIDLRDKPEWYKELVPTALVPAVKFDDGEVVWESADIANSLESRFPESPLLPAEGSAGRARADEMMERCQELLSAGVRVSYPNASATEQERAAGLSKFESELDRLDAAAAEAGGPFLSGEVFSLVDAMYIPMMERWAVQLPLTTDIELTGGRSTGGAPPRWPAIDRWLRSMDAELPEYSDCVKGDAYSWTSLVGTFQRMFSSANSTEIDPERARAAAEAISRADAAASAELRDLEAMGMDDFSLSARREAARAVVANRANIVADALNAQPKTQTHLRRLDGETDGPLVELALREACRTLLDLPEEADGDDPYTVEPGDASVVAQAAKYVASRICVPRDMGAPAAAAARCALLRLSHQAGSYAWKASGGLL